MNRRILVPTVATFAMAIFVAACGSSSGTTGADGDQLASAIDATSRTDTFGNDSPGLPITSASGDYKRASKFTLLSNNASVGSLSAYLDGLGGAAGTQSARAAIYADASGSPAARLCVSSTTSIAANAPASWMTFPVSDCALSAGVYWLALQTGPTVNVARYYGVALAGGLRHNSDLFSDGASDPFGANPASADSLLAIYANVSLPPTASFNHSPASPTIGQPVQFASTSACPVAPCTYSYQNEQADGTFAQFATTANASFTYKNAGTKVVQLVVTDSQGHSSSITENVLVSVAGGGGGALRWAPPTLSSPTTINLPAGKEFFRQNLSTSQDYILELPPGGRGPLWISGGHNVVLIGGHITIPADSNQTDNGADHTNNGIYIDNSTGTVHIEGVLINHPESYITMYDGIDVSAPSATVQVENVRIENLWGTKGPQGPNHLNMHADAIQTWGGAKDLRVDHLTANGSYQGLQIGPAVVGRLGSAELQNIDLTDDAPPPALASVTSGGGILIWLTGTGCDATPTTMTNVYLVNARGMSPGSMVWPATTSGLSCDATYANGEISWPGLSMVKGHAAVSSPPGGSFVPSGVAGDSYSTPGYLP